MKKKFIIFILIFLGISVFSHMAIADNVPLDNPLTGGQGADVVKEANTLIKGALGITGILALIAFIWGGIEWLISMGDSKRIQKGKDMMIWAVIGLIVIFGSYAILSLVFKVLGAST